MNFVLPEVYNLPPTFSPQNSGQFMDESDTHVSADNSPFLQEVLKASFGDLSLEQITSNGQLINWGQMTTDEPAFGQTPKKGAIVHQDQTTTDGTIIHQGQINGTIDNQDQMTANGAIVHQGQMATNGTIDNKAQMATIGPLNSVDRITEPTTHSDQEVIHSQCLPPPPVVLRRNECKTPANGMSVEDRRRSAVPAGLRAVHVVSGLAKDMNMPVPDQNRTMARGDFGDDAAFFVETKHKYILGISDGAGGNRGYGFDPREFARQLMRHCAGYVLQRSKDHLADLDPLQTVFNALQMCQDRKVYGSGTVCLCSLEKCSGKLDTINIGDSGFLIFRKGQIFTRARRHYRNDGSKAPIQVDVYPWSFEQRAKFMLESGEIGNVNLMRDKIQTQPGDVLLMASDGVFDSIPLEQILAIIQQGLWPQIESLQSDPEAVKRFLAKTADSIVAATKNTGIAPDDVIVVLARL